VRPSIARNVHYVSYGTPGGEYDKACRAAVITEVRDDETVGLAVLNPKGVFFTESEFDGRVNASGGTWHWPERVE
jgi:hypothetical protein